MTTGHDDGSLGSFFRIECTDIATDIVCRWATCVFGYHKAGHSILVSEISITNITETKIRTS